LIFSFQHIGKRDNQEDAYHIDAQKNLYIVCDGVGGMDAGEIASNKVIQYVTEHLSRYTLNPLCTNCIITAIKQAQSKLNEYVQNNPKANGTATTIALLYYHNGTAITAHSGDSKVIFAKKNGAGCWSTKDHSTVQELYDADILKSEQEMNSHPLKNRITSAIIAGQDPAKVTIATHELQNIEQGDIFLLCTDGVLELYSTEEISNIALSRDHKKYDGMSKFIQSTSKDNSTLILVEV